MINSQKQGGQFGPDTGVNLLRNQGGQFGPKKWGQFARNFQANGTNPNETYIIQELNDIFSLHYRVFIQYSEGTWQEVF